VEELCGLDLPIAQSLEDGLLTHVLRCDHFGNLILDASHEQLRAAGMRLGEALTVEVAGEVHPARYASTFADVAPGELLLYEDAQLMVALAVNRDSAAALLAVARDSELLVRRA
jgi:S-adenosyl-L-methionine hydrolase (adenosine-forming)